jgi:DNA polymerase-3 subunit epsilon
VYLFFDTETAGLPANYDAPPSKGPNWPRLVTLAWVLTDSRGRELRSAHDLVRPDGWTISPETTVIHGITQEHAQKCGRSVWPILERFGRELYGCSAVLAHNYRFDSGVVGSEFMRQGCPDPFPPKLSLCTMLASVDVCRLPGKRAGTWKWPRLAELHRHLFGQEHSGQHDALADVRACSRCFFELRQRDLLPGCRMEPSELEAARRA